MKQALRMFVPNRNQQMLLEAALGFRSNNDDHHNNCNRNYQQTLFAECTCCEIMLRLV